MGNDCPALGVESATPRLTLGTVTGDNNTIWRIQAQIRNESSYRKRRQLQRDFLAEVTRQEAALSEVPGLEGQAAALAVLRERVKLFFRLD